MLRDERINNFRNIQVIKTKKIYLKIGDKVFFL
jgi:hypothetical protein